MVRLDRQYIMCAGAAVVAGLLFVSLANAQSVPDTVPLSYSTAQIFAKALRDQTAAADETEWSDFSALAYAQSRRSAPAGVQWLAQPLPAVDGFNGKIDGYGGGANHSSSLYGANGSLSIPLAQQWGLQIDGGVGSFDSSGTARGAGHVFWRDPFGAFAQEGRLYKHSIDLLPAHVLEGRIEFLARTEHYRCNLNSEGSRSKFNVREERLCEWIGRICQHRHAPRGRKHVADEFSSLQARDQN